MLLPADARSWLPPDHLAWQVTGVIGELDLSGFAAAYRADGQGQAPYDPAMMVALLFYCYFKGIRSSRKIAAACIDDVGCRVICGGAAPSHQAVAMFIRRHRAEVKRLFVQVLSLLAAEGAVAGHVAAVDGSPVSGNASRFANLAAGQLAERIAATEAAIDAEAEAWLAGVGGGQQPLQYGNGEEGGGGGGGGGAARRRGCRWRRGAAAAGRAGRHAGPAAGRAGQARRAAGWPGQPGRPDRRGPGGGGGCRAAAGAGRGGPGRQDGRLRLRGGCREGLAVRQEAGAAGPGGAGGAGPQEPDHRAGPAGCGPAGRRRLPGEGLGHRPGLPAAAGQERRLPAGLEPAAGRRPPGRSCSPPSCTTTPPTPAPWCR